MVESGFIGSRRIAQSIIDYNELADVIHIYSSYDDISASIMEQVRLDRQRVSGQAALMFLVYLSCMFFLIISFPQIGIDLSTN